MKNFKLFLFSLAILAISVCSGCAQNIYGDYTGTVSITSTTIGVNESFDGITVELATDGSDNYLRFEDLGFGGFVIPELNNVIITPNGDGYILSRPGEINFTIPEITIPPNSPILPGVTLYDVPVKITFENGSIVNNVMNLQIKAVATVVVIIPISIPMYVSFEGSMSIQELEYDPIAVACINAMIDNNGLDAEKNKPETWEFADWSEEENLIQLFGLDLDDESLFGALSLVGLSKLSSLECRMNNLTEIILTGCTNVEEIYCWGNHLTAIDLSGLDALSDFVGEGQSIQLSLNNDGNGNYLYAIPLNSPTFSETAISYEAGILKSIDPTVALTYFTVETGNSQFQLSGGMLFTYTGVGIVETDNPSIMVYPNPTTGEVTMDNGQLTINSIEVLDIYGRVITSHYSLLTTHYSIDISHLQPCIYFVRVNTEKGSFMQKVVKQ
jgi:hypothetical protein